jgi:cytoskeletal protein CcmA (bactofilin family)
MNPNNLRVHSVTQKNLNGLVFCIIFILALLLPVAAEASVVRTGESVTLKSDQVVEGDFYGLGSQVALSGEVAEDSVVAAGSATLNGSVGADVLIIGGAVVVDGSVADDVRVVAGSVQVSGEIKGDLVVLAGELTVLSTASIGGDILFFGGKADVAGYVGKNILGTSEQLRIDATVDGNLNVKTDLLTLGDQANIAGGVTYTSYVEMIRGQNAVVAGTVVRNISAPEIDYPLRNAAILFLVFLFASLVSFLFLRTFSTRVAEVAQTHVWRSLLIGLGVLFAVPVVGLVLVVSTLGSIVGFTLFGMYIAIVMFATASLGAVVGYMLQVWRKQTGALKVGFVLLGVLLTQALFFIPVLGPLCFLTLFCLTLGAVSEQLYRRLREV